MEIYYINSRGDLLYLDRKPYYMTQDTDLFDSSWKYEESNRVVDNVYKGIEEKKMQIAIIGENEPDCHNKIDELLDCVEIDTANNANGKLYVGDYYINCYFVEDKKKPEYISNNHALIELKLVQKNPYWIKETLSKYRYEDKQSTSGYDYPYDYPHSYGINNGFYGSLENSHFAESNFVMIIYGYAVNPCVVIGGNIYRLNCTIKEGDRVVINSADQTITLIHANDQRENAFRYRDQTNDIFRKIQPGTSSVLWNAKFDFDIWLCTERSEPEWST